MYIGDFFTSDVVNVKFTTNNSTGAPSALSAATVKVYKDDDTTTESTAGVNLSTSFDSLPGLNNVKVDTSADGTFYASGHDFMIVLTAGTVDSTSVTQVLGAFSIMNRSALRPTVKGRTLDVSSGGEAGLDWANIGSPTTAEVLSGTTIGVSTTIGATGLTAIAAAVWDALTSGLTTVASIGKLLVDNVNATILSRLPTSSYTAPDNAGIGTINSKIGTPSGTVSSDIAAVNSNVIAVSNQIGAPIGASISADIQTRLPTSSYTAPDNAGIAAIKAKTDNLPASPASSGEVAAVAGDVWDITLADHEDAGSTGEALSDAGGGASPTDIAAAVWDEDLSGHVTDGTAGKILSETLAFDEYTAPDNAGIGAIKAKTDNLPGDPASNTAVNTAASNVVSVLSPLVNAVAGDVWDVALASHEDTGSTGEALAAASSGGSTPSEIADAVWDELLSGHTASGSAGQILTEIDTGVQALIAGGGGTTPGTIVGVIEEDIEIEGIVNC